jgi:hypothetical protein
LILNILEYMIAPMKKKYWSGRVTKESNALDLEGGVFKLSTPP